MWILQVRVKRRSTWASTRMLGTWLTTTPPTSSCSNAYQALSRSCVKTPACSPYLLSLTLHICSTMSGVVEESGRAEKPAAESRACSLYMLSSTLHASHDGSETERDALSCAQSSHLVGPDIQGASCVMADSLALRWHADKCMAYINLSGRLNYNIMAPVIRPLGRQS